MLLQDVARSVLSCFQQNTYSSDQLTKWIHFHCVTTSLNQFGSKYLIVSSDCVLLSFSHSLQFINNYSLKSRLPFPFSPCYTRIHIFFPFSLCWALHVVAARLSKRVRVWWYKFSLLPFSDYLTWCFQIFTFHQVAHFSVFSFMVGAICIELDFKKPQNPSCWGI